VARFEDVVNAAMRVTARSSLDELTVAAVAAELNVTSPAVYHHVPGGKSGLTELVVQSVARSIMQPAFEEHPGDDWLDRLERAILTISSANRRYPGVMAYLVTTGRDTDESMVGAEFVLRQLEAGGFEGQARTNAFDAVNALVTGWTVTRRASADAAAAAGYRAVAATASAPRDTDDEGLQRALHALLRGLQSAPPRSERRRRRSSAEGR
jgi:TetR/AcrR family transcriptional regulator, tetracycline repressor protein